MMEILMTYVAIWAPSLVAVLGTVAAVVLAINKATAAIRDIKLDKTFVELNNKLSTMAKENEELVKCNKLLLDQITKIKDYADQKEK
jgi:hypothetical protein